MTKIMISLIILLGFAFPSWSEESSYLEGISILGEKRIAYISIPGGKIAVTEGDEITISEGTARGTWQVVLIKADSVLFKTHEGFSAELRLDHRLPLPVANESVATKLKVDNELATNSDQLIANNELAATNPEELITDEELIIDNEEISIDEELPPLTPSATLINEPNTQTPSPPQPAATVANTSHQQPIEQEPLPLDHQLVKTPFGTFTIKSKEE
jgi:hypothetical protein